MNEENGEPAGEQAAPGGTARATWAAACRRANASRRQSFSFIARPWFTSGGAPGNGERVMPELKSYVMVINKIYTKRISK
ncbi:hypothetical protein [Burkholderia plantarii]|uniref:hypothetical protein n=1 Tax=Burkholderia plantarii TaxID=41899 RepID=UPI000A6DCD68|nr:hypothetical protein [Burkholderia plantarii]